MAEVIEIYDEWVGEGPSHRAFLRLERHKQQFVVRAKITDYGTVGERVLDPTAPAPPNGKPLCVCAIENKCACESPKRLRRTKTVESAAVERFLVAVAGHGIDPQGKLRIESLQSFWTDDYRRAHVVIWIDREARPIHLSFRDQHRFWLVDGVFLSPDKCDAFHDNAEEEKMIGHPQLTKIYEKMLNDLGFDSWLQERQNEQNRQFCPDRGDPLCSH